MLSVVQFIRQITPPGPADEATDGQLLERFVGQRDEAAFATLLRRHAPLVLAVCRRALPSAPDAEDAFQATFLVLARNAASITKRGSVASWLHGVARRIARRARADIARRRTVEERFLPQAAPDSLRELVWQDLRSILDDEVSRLPERYRAVFVLCYLEGKTNDEAARLLGCPRGTVSSRLVRARAMLRARLSRRGLALSAAFVTTLLAPTAVSATVPARLLGSTAQAALQAGTGRLAAAGLVSGRVVSLTEGVAKAMLMTKLRMAALLLGLGVTIAGVGAVAVQPVPTDPPQAAAEGRIAEERSAPVKSPSPPQAPGRAKAEPPAGTPTNPAEEYLRRCEEKLLHLGSCAATVRRTSLDKTFQAVQVSEGTVKYQRPDLFLLEMQQEGNPKRFEKYVWAGKLLYEYDPQRKEVRVHELPLAEMAGLPIVGRLFRSFCLLGEGPLGPSSLLRESDETRRRCHVKLVKEDQWYPYIELRPRTREDEADFRRGRLVLTKESCLPRQIWFEQPNGNEVTWDILRIEENIPLTREEFTAARLPPGWKLNRLSRRPVDDPPATKVPPPDQP